jgi:hypothetical protein
MNKILRLMIKFRHPSNPPSHMELSRSHLNKDFSPDPPQADLRGAIHKKESMRQGIPHSGDPQSRLDLERKTSF